MESASAHSADEKPVRATGSWRLRVTLVLLAIIAVWVGLPTEGGLRGQFFEQTRPIRFREDAERGFHWGRQCLEVGYFALYDTFVYNPADADTWLDYAPLRLGVMRFWAWCNSTRFPEAVKYQNTLAFAQPVLWFNTAIELIGAAGMFLLVRHWARRKIADPSQLAPDTGLRRAFLAAMLMWFSPVALVSAHGWPTWDIWVPVFFIWAIYCACREWWFWAGVVIGVGAMFKGQLLVVAMPLLVWPIAAGAPTRMLRCVLIAIGLLCLRLLLQTGAIGFAIGLALVGVLGVIAYDAVRFGQWTHVLRWGCGFVLATALIVLGWMVRTIDGHANVAAIFWIAFVLAGLAAAWFYFPKTRRFRFAYAGVIGVAILLCMPFFGASSKWHEYGWRFGTTHFNQLIVGLPNNIPALLVKRYGFWNSAGTANGVVFTVSQGLFAGLPFTPIPITLRALMQGIFVILTIPCAVAAARHARRNDASFLVAICTPWLLFYMLPLQIHERYLLYFAIASICFIAVSSGHLLIHLVTMFFSAAVTLNILLNPTRRNAFAWENPGSLFVVYGNELRAFTNALHPDSAWAMGLMLLICLYLSLRPAAAQREGATDLLAATRGD